MRTSESSTGGLPRGPCLGDVAFPLGDVHIAPGSLGRGDRVHAAFALQRSLEVLGERFFDDLREAAHAALGRLGPQPPVYGIGQLDGRAHACIVMHHVPEKAPLASNPCATT